MTMIGFDRRDAKMGLGLFRMMLRDRFLGSALGLIWAIVHPLLMLSIFTFVFGFVFRSRLPGATTSLGFVIWLISGYAPWLAISEALTSSALSVAGNSGIVKNLAFKTELLPIASVLTGLVPLGVGLVFLIALLAAEGGVPAWPWLVVPLGAVLQFLLLAGLGLILSAATVFVRDIAMALPNLLLLMLFASPILYPLDAFPAVLRPFAWVNPFYVVTEMYRAPLVEHMLPPWASIAYLAILSVLLFWAGLVFFRRLKAHFDSRL
jgi:homopolymeric O-antigen transport system permease protein